MNLKAIETRFKGITYRSRLEARWAVFYHDLRVPFLYEPEGYSFDGIGYLPDFFLPEQDCFVEIKPTWPTDEEKNKARKLCLHTEKQVFIFSGAPQAPSEDNIYWESGLKYSVIDDSGEAKVADDFAYWWCQCQSCGAYDIQFNGRSYRIRNHSQSCSRPTEGHPDKGYNHDAESLLSAYHKAASYRFENGEQ